MYPDSLNEAAARALSAEARTILRQLLFRADVDEASVERENASFVAWARGVVDDGSTLYRMARADTPEDALIKLLAGYRLIDTHGKPGESLSHERHLRAVGDVDR